MLFNSFQFLIFFPIVVLLYYVIPDRFKNVWLLLASYYFYMSWNAKYGLLLLFCTLITYGASRVLEGTREKKKAVFIVSLIMVFSVLVYYKYFNFLIDNIRYFADTFGMSLKLDNYDIILPVGISFFTFQSAGYLIDVYRGDTKAEKSFLTYALFVSFFPQLVAGPIERSKNLLKQLKTPRRFDYDRAREGFYLMLWGFFMKMVIADRAAILVDNIYGSYTERGGAAIVMATIIFAFQIYGDFGGYSTIAMGAAKILGIELIDNFKSPFLSVSIGDFWARWHISLNDWFKDYVYIPLGGSRKGKLRKHINLMIVFVVSGFWHGARWSYVLWGVLNGVYSIWEEVTMPFRKKVYSFLNINTRSFGHKLFRWIITFAFANFAMIFFRAEGAKKAFSMIVHVLKNPRTSSVLAGAQYTYGLDENNFKLLILSIILLMVVDFMKDRGISVRKHIMRQDTWFRVLVAATSVIFIAVFGIWGNAYNAQSFIYFQF